MNKSKELHKKVVTLLLQGRLKQAINTLTGAITPDSDWDLYTRFTQMSNAYGYMLEYLRTDMPDPNREKLYHNLIGQCLIINDELALAHSQDKIRNIYSEYRTKYNNTPATAVMHRKLADNIGNIAVAHMIPAPESQKVKKELMQQHEQLLKEAFYRLWTSTGWKNYNCDEVFSLITDSAITENDAATLTSAITLGLFNCFEPQKAILLCRLAMTENQQISTRALTGLILLLQQFDERLQFYPDLLFAIESLGDDEKTKRRIQTIQIQLIRCRETQKIDKEMREVIIPAMMKNPNIRNGKMGVEIDAEELSGNPEWEEWAKKENIKGKIEEMTRWQMEGADVYMTTFSQLKRFPFFDELHNWVRPFDKEVPEITEIIPNNTVGKKTLLDAICSSRFFCNSDKYSFCFTLKQVPEEQRNMMLQQIPDNEENEDGPETLSSAPKEQKSEILSNQYIQDLYRLFKISKFRKEFSDPFTLSLNMLESKHLAFLVQDTDSIRYTFEYLVEKEYYAEAHRVGSMLEKKQGNDAGFYQKMGYCMQKSGEYRKAIDYYTKADIVMPDSLWTIRRMAQCYRILGEFDNALHYYITAEELRPDDKRLLLQTGECLAMLKRYDEAFARFFKVEYLDPNSLRAWRAIAWCSFITGNDKRARHYYEKLINGNNANCEDFINAAHVEWISGKKQKAVELYQKSKEMLQDTEAFIATIETDKETLIERGVSDFELKLLRDLFY